MRHLYGVCGHLHFVVVSVQHPQFVLVVGKQAALQVQQVQQRLRLALNVALQTSEAPKLLTQNWLFFHTSS